MKNIDASLRVTKVTRSIAALVLAAACGGSTALSGQANSPNIASTTTPAPTVSTTGAASPSASVAKVSANNATNAQLVTALTAAGVPNPANWAREVAEYRPYDASDANMTKLRQNLAKYNPAPGVVDKIISALSLP